MSIVTLEEARNYLRIADSADDALLESLIQAAEEYIRNATGNTFTSADRLAVLLVLMLVADWYEHREAAGQARAEVRPIVQSMVCQLKHAYPASAGE